MSDTAKLADGPFRTGPWGDRIGIWDEHGVPTGCFSDQESADEHVRWLEERVRRRKAYRASLGEGVTFHGHPIIWDPPPKKVAKKAEQLSMLDFIEKVSKKEK